VHNILRVRAITIEGDVIELGSAALDTPGYDLLALITGSGPAGGDARGDGPAARQARGRAVVMASFPDVESAGEAVARVIGAGIIPAASR